MRYDTRRLRRDGIQQYVTTRDSCVRTIPYMRHGLSAFDTELCLSTHRGIVLTAPHVLLRRTLAAPKR
jgi:hypothetical protein